MPTAKLSFIFFQAVCPPKTQRPITRHSNVNIQPRKDGVLPMQQPKKVNIVYETPPHMVKPWLIEQAHLRQGALIIMQGGRGVLIIMRGRSRMTIDPRIFTMPGRSASGFHRPGRHLLTPSAKRAVRCSASRMMGGLHPTKNRS